jgi:hypothetical protein
MGHPHSEEKPFKILALPWAIHSLLPFPLVPVISSTKFIVSNPSVNPEAIIRAYGKIIFKVSSLK